MAVGYRSSSAFPTPGDGTGSPLSIPVPSGAAAGDIALLAIEVNSGNPAITWPSGFTEKISFQNSPDLAIKVAWKRLTGADTGNYSPTYTSTGQFRQGQCILLTGAITTGDPIEVSNTAQADGATAVPSVAVTTVTSVFLVHFGALFNFRVSTAPTSYTRVQDANYLDTSYRIAAGTGVQTASGGTVATTTDHVVALLAVLPDAGGGTTPVTATRATTWTVRAAVTSSRATTWDVLSARTGTRPTTWDVLVRVTATRATLWDTLTPVTATRATTWRVAARTTGTRPTTWDVLTPAASTRATTWTVRAQVTVTRSTTWQAKAQTTGNRATTWRVRSAVTATRSTTWDVASTSTVVVATRATTWAVGGKVTGTRATTWDVTTQIALTRIATWDALASLAATRGTTWRTLARSTATCSATWAVESDLGPPTESVLTTGNALSSGLTVAHPQPDLTSSNAPSSHLEVSHGV